MGNKKEIRILTEEEIDALIGKCEYDDTRDLMRILRESGCRVSEVLNLKVKDVEFADGCAVMTVNGKTGTRAVPVCATAPVLKRYIAGKGNDENLFRYSSYMTQWSRIRKLTERLGIVKGEKKRVLFHGIRHYAATHYLREGVPDAIVKKLMGWSPESSQFNTYSHLDYHDVMGYMKNGGNHYQPLFLWSNICN